MRVAVVGCGAVAEFFHLPAIARVLSRDDVWLVDPDQSRALALARRFGRAEHVTMDHRELEVDAAIVAVPNDLHAPVAIDLLGRGVSVLVEKPLARTAAEARTIVDAAGESTLAVGNFRRFFPRPELPGRPLRFTADEGFVYAWSAASGYALDRNRAGGGVTIDLGSHVLDQLAHWLGPLELVGYADDAHGGVEADARLELRAGEATGTVELSRTRELGSRVVIDCEGGTVEAPLALGGDYVDAFEAQLRAFLAGEPAVSGQEALATAELVDECYRRREPLPEPWTFETLLRA